MSDELQLVNDFYKKRKGFQLLSLNKHSKGVAAETTFRSWADWKVWTCDMLGINVFHKIYRSKISNQSELKPRLKQGINSCFDL
jgi:hypothetical protein